MIRYFFKTIQGRIVGLFILCMTTTCLVSFYTIRYASQAAMSQEKEAKLLSVAQYLDRVLGEQSYDDILDKAGASGGGKEEQIDALNHVLAARTDEVAALFPGLGTGYYSRQLDAILTYGPSETYGDRVGLPIASDHPGRVAMSENRGIVQVGTMVRGHIMNAMYPVVRGGSVIGYAWANELTSSIQSDYSKFTSSVMVFLLIFFIISLGTAIVLSRRMVRDIGTIVAGIRGMRDNLTVRIQSVGGELGEVVSSINHMAENIEKNTQEHEALLRSEAANTAQRDFLSRMSHEMRTPMNAVIGMTGIARKSGDIAAVHRYLDKINEAANHLLGVINDVLDISKIEAGKLELQPTSFSFRSMIDRVVTVVGFKIEEKRQRFTVELDGAIPDYILADRQWLAQVIANLLSNASKFTPEEGCVWLRADRLTDRNGMCRLRVEVEDDGIGISEEQQNRLFRSFEQVDSGVSRKYGGTGLGLAISKRIIEMMHGRVWIESEVSKGSKFIFEVDVGIGEADTEETLVSSETHGKGLPGADQDLGFLSGRRILLAEDVAINREIVIALLESADVQIDCAENGVEAVRMFTENPVTYDMILMDVRMPEMDGCSATKAIRDSGVPRAKEVPIVAMTANVFKEDIEMCLEAGMNGHIGKPLDITEVSAVLRNYLRAD